LNNLSGHLPSSWREGFRGRTVSIRSGRIGARSWDGWLTIGAETVPDFQALHTDRGVRLETQTDFAARDFDNRDTKQRLGHVDADDNRLLRLSRQN
jgi:hypothetical protein